jgi:uncharacterized membrane protein
MTKTRLEAFSDGVLAIIITIMVLELHTPHGTGWGALRPLIPVFMSYILSFIVVGIYWGNHHHLLHAVNHVTSRMIWANLHLLFWLSLIPFGTAWMGESNFTSITVATYAVLVNCCGVAYFILLKTIERTHPGHPGLADSLKKQSRKGAMSVLLYGLAIPAAFVHVAISGALFLLVSVMWWIPDRNIERSVQNGEAAPDHKKNEHLHQP